MSPSRVNTRRIIKTFYRSWWRRPLWLVTIFLVIPLLVGRVALNPLLVRAVRHHLSTTSHVAAATFSDLDVFLFPPSFTFRDVVIRGPSGEKLEVDRLEVHLTSLRELRASAPHIRLRLVRPQLALVPGAGDLARWLRALPSARVDVTGVEKGSLSNATNREGLPLFQDIRGEIEGLEVGAPLAGGPPPTPARANDGGPLLQWQIWLDAKLDASDPFHAIVKVQPDGVWEASFTLQQVTSSGPPSGSGSVAVDARAKGKGAQTGAVMAITWPGSEVPVALAQDRLNRLGTRWPHTDLVVKELRAGTARVGQSLDLVVVSGGTEATPAGASFNPLDALGLALNLIRLSNQALLPPPPGMAALTGEETATAAQAEQPPAPSDSASP